MAHAISLARVALAPGILWAALQGSGRLACLALLVAGATDILDGYVSRRTKSQSRFGRRLDSTADSVVLIATSAALVIMHPAILNDSWPLLTAAAILYPLSAGAPRRTTTKIAGALLYAFAIFTLATGDYVPALLWTAAIALAASSLEGILRSLRRMRTPRKTMELNPSISNTRSHAPHATKDVGSSASPTSSIATSAAPSPNRSLP